jgi:hypothetical protein
MNQSREQMPLGVTQITAPKYKLPPQNSMTSMIQMDSMVDLMWREMGS